MLLGKPERIIRCNSEFLRRYKTFVENATHPVIFDYVFVTDASRLHGRLSYNEFQEK